MFKTCVWPVGEVDERVDAQDLGLLRAYDQAADGGLHGWRYKPYEIGGEAVPVCGIVTFIYQIK